MSKCKAVIALLVVVLVSGISGCTKQVESVIIDKGALTIEHGGNFVLSSTVFPKDAVDRSIVWSVDTQNVSAVTNENTPQKEFLAANVGEANIKVVSTNGLEAVCKVTVTENADDKAAREKAEEEARIAKAKAEEAARVAKEKAEQEAKKARMDELIKKIDKWEKDGLDEGAAFAEGYTQAEVDEANAQRRKKATGKASSITEERAFQIAWEHSTKKYRLTLDHEDETTYTFHEYEDFPDHTATVNWINVDKHTGAVDSMF